MGLFSDFLGKHTGPNDHIQAGKFDFQDGDIDLEPSTDVHGNTTHAMSKDLNQELEELKNAFNSSSPEAQKFFVQKIVRTYPDEVREFLKEVS